MQRWAPQSYSWDLGMGTFPEPSRKVALRRPWLQACEAPNRGCSHVGLDARSTESEGTTPSSQVLLVTQPAQLQARAVELCHLDKVLHLSVPRSLGP